MVDQDDYIKQEGIYAHSGGGLYRILSYCSQPTLMMENVKTGKRFHFGVSGLINDEFTRVDGLKFVRIIGDVTKV